MTLWIGHYHLQRGGVARVVEAQIAALKDLTFPESVAVLTGAPPEIPVRAPLVSSPALDYVPEKLPASRYRALADEIRGLFDRHIERGDLVHFHNPNLGKNPVLTVVLAELADRGTPLLLQCHDFAEDRPRNHAFLREVVEGVFGADLRQVMYPCSPRCRFGVLNSHDARRMQEMGVDERRVTLLPNPAVLPPDIPGEVERGARERLCAHFGISPGKSIFLYPIRVIPRKNIGELILLMTLFAQRAVALVTLPPHNPSWRESYHDWVRFAGELGAPVLFEASRRVPFATLMRGADRMITTSTREGFGMMYLEPWLFGKPVVGRRIPMVVEDFEASGIVFEGLYDEIPVRRRGSVVDFGRLGEREQREAVRRLLEDDRQRASLRERLAPLLFAEIAPELVGANRELIEREYSIERYAERLLALYAQLAEPSQADTAD